MNILVINAGSSSLKYQLINTETEVSYAKGLCEKIGLEGSNISHKNNSTGKKFEKIAAMPDHAVAMQYVIEALTDAEAGCITSMDDIDAIGHRVVHGGPYFSDSILLTDEVFETLKRCRAFAPLHTDAHIMGINGCLSVMPNKPQVLVFDTAFHSTMAPEAYFYALPYAYYEKYSIRRYGAHGTSHRFVSAEMAKILGKPIEDTKIITCHIGNGSSITAVKGGKVVDTSMGFTPVEGLVMGTRVGDLDAGALLYIMDMEGLDTKAMNTLINNTGDSPKIAAIIDTERGFWGDGEFDLAMIGYMRDDDFAAGYGYKAPRDEHSRIRWALYELLRRMFDCYVWGAEYNQHENMVTTRAWVRKQYTALLEMEI